MADGQRASSTAAFSAVASWASLVCGASAFRHPYVSPESRCVPSPETPSILQNPKPQFLLYPDLVQLPASLAPCANAARLIQRRVYVFSRPQFGRATALTVFCICKQSNTFSRPQCGRGLPVEVGILAIVQSFIVLHLFARSQLCKIAHSKVIKITFHVLVVAVCDCGEGAFLRDEDVSDAAPLRYSFCVQVLGRSPQNQFCPDQA